MNVTSLIFTAALAVRAMAAPVPPAKISEATLKTAIETYAPILTMHEYEKYMPTSVESYLAVTEPIHFQDRESGKTFTGLRLKTSVDPKEQEKLRAGDPVKAKTYVNVKVGDKETDLQYWFLYAYNGPGIAYFKKLDWKLRYSPIGSGDKDKKLGPGDYELGEMGVHEGDWEHITVTVDNRTGLITKGIYMAAHDSGQYYKLSEMAQSGEPRVKVYASRNGHATYLNRDRSYHVTVKAGFVEFRLLNDTTLPDDVGKPDPKKTIDFRKRWEIIGIQGDPALKAALDFQEPSYEKDYPGRWGRVAVKPHPLAHLPVVGDVDLAKDFTEMVLKKVGAWDELTFEAGPWPPWHKGSWTGPE